MNNLLSDRVKNMNESATLRMAQLARQLKAEGKNIISLSLGEPDFDTPESIKKAAYKAMQEGYTKYSPVNGMPELKKAISEKFKRENNLDYSPEQIMVSNGAKQSIANVCMSVLNEGDEAIIFAPYWVSYYDIISMIGGKPVPVVATIDNDFKVTPEQVKAALTPKTKLVIFSSPCNPTGSVYLREELEAIAEVLKDEDLYILADEIYEHINFTEAHASIGSIEGVKDKTITVNGFSKGYAMTGWRLGYMGGPTELINACSKIQGQFTSGATTFSQIAAAWALSEHLHEQDTMKSAFRDRRDLLIKLMSDIPGIKVNKPQGAFYLFPDVSALIGKSTPSGDIINNSSDLCEYFLLEANVALVEGSAFGMENHIRLSYATSQEELTEAVSRIKEAVNNLR